MIPPDPAAPSAWKEGDIAYRWTPSREDRFASARGVVIDPDLAGSSGWIVIRLDDGGEWRVDPEAAFERLFRSPASLRVWLLTSDLACAQRERAKLYEHVAICEGEVRAAEVRLAQAVAAARDDEKGCVAEHAAGEKPKRRPWDDRGWHPNDEGHG